MNVARRPGSAAALLGLLLSAACGSRPSPAAAPAAATAADARPLTFDRDVAPVLFEHCAVCHRPGQAVPFTLLAYADVRKHADKIADAVKAREMPPWLPEP